MSSSPAIGRNLDLNPLYPIGHQAIPQSLNNQLVHRIPVPQFSHGRLKLKSNASTSNIRIFTLHLDSRGITAGHWYIGFEGFGGTAPGNQGLIKGTWGWTGMEKREQWSKARLRLTAIRLYEWYFTQGPRMVRMYKVIILFLIFLF